MDRAILIEHARRRGRTAIAPPLLDWIPEVSPELSSPRHLSPLVDVFARAFAAARGDGPPVFACFSAPPQVGKTLTGQHALAWWLRQAPGDFLAYLSYGQGLASKKSRGVRDLARRTGISLRLDSRAVDLWETTASGGLLARGVQAGITGHSAVKLAWVDDPFRNRAEAESRVIRDKIDDDFRSTIFSRRHPTTSIIVSHTRWHEDDLIGRIQKRNDGRWEFFNVKAISDAGEPLWPESGRDLAFWTVQRQESTEYVWWSLYQGEPRPRGGHVFGDPSFYDSLPSGGLRYAIGVDLAYTAKTHADYSAAVVVARGADGCTYVVDVVRRQCAAPDFAATLLALQAAYPGAPLRWYASGTERGSADFLARGGVRLRAIPPKGDKFVRATPAAAAWGAGRVLVPRAAAWTPAFLDEVLEFTGVSDAHDDQVDALVAAFDSLADAGGSVALSSSVQRLTPYGPDRATRRDRPYGTPRRERPH